MNTLTFAAAKVLLNKQLACIVDVASDHLLLIAHGTQYTVQVSWAAEPGALMDRPIMNPPNANTPTSLR